MGNALVQLLLSCWFKEQKPKHELSLKPTDFAGLQYPKGWKDMPGLQEAVVFLCLQGTPQMIWISLAVILVALGLFKVELALHQDTNLILLA